MLVAPFNVSVRLVPVTVCTPLVPPRACPAPFASKSWLAVYARFRASLGTAEALAGELRLLLPPTRQLPQAALVHTTVPAGARMSNAPLVAPVTPPAEALNV